MIVWVVSWNEETKDICTSRENAISAAKNFLEAELEDTFVSVDEMPFSTCIKGLRHILSIYNQETDLWV